MIQHPKKICVSVVNRHSAWTKILGGGSEKLVDEFHVRDHVLFIGNKAEKSAEFVRLITLELLAQGHEDVLDLGEGDFAGAVLVEDLQAFNVVLLYSGSGGVGLDGGEDGAEVGEGDSLLAQRLGASVGSDGCVGHVAAQRAEDVAQVEGIDIVAFVGLVEDNESVLSFTHFDLEDFCKMQMKQREACKTVLIAGS